MHLACARARQGNGRSEKRGQTNRRGGLHGEIEAVHDALYAFHTLIRKRVVAQPKNRILHGRDAAVEVGAVPEVPQKQGQSIFNSHV
jgi:hypothetical protein